MISYLQPAASISFFKKDRFSFGYLKILSFESGFNAFSVLVLLSLYALYELIYKNKIEIEFNSI